ncbi:FAD-dependent monooxygenase [Streptomyces erythrochromogenes]|uniref:FAD-dependent monooxygenase n=1 Tax=Streptomyces erythrochromogenes TaxID=285574 RepID=UPI0036AC0C26
MQTQVAVAGGGPVGMLVAAELAGYGVDVVVFEVRADVSERPKATTLHARAVQCLARRGHLPPEADAGPRGAAAGDFHFAGLPGLAIPVPRTEPVPILKSSQPQLERHFEARARAAGARVLRGHRVTGIEQDREGVRLKVEGPDGTAVCEARYLVGADGARSTVREQAGIASDTSPATVSALTGLVTLEEGEAVPDGFLRTPRGWIVSKKLPGAGTSIRTLDCRGAFGDRHLPVSLEEFRLEVSRIAGRDIAMGRPRWLGRFSDYTRLARTFREGRVFLVGDAAHVHFPIGGQGLSAGVLDALCLGWKLALAVRGEAGPALLDSYDPERRGAAQAVVENTRAQLALMRPGPEVDALRSVLAGVVAADRGAGRLGNMISAQDTVLPGYTQRPSPWEGTFFTNMPLITPEGGTDVIGLLRDGRPLLLLSGDGTSRHRAVVRPWEPTVRVVELSGPGPGPAYDAVLVRPDGYVAWSSGGGELGAALSRYFGAGRGTGPGTGSGCVPRLS